MKTGQIDSPTPVRVLCTQDFRPHQSFHAWGEMVDDACGPLHVYRTEPGEFRGIICAGTFGTVQLASIQAGPHSVERTERLARRAASTPLHLTCVLDGEVRVSQGERTAVVRPGSLFSYDGSHPFRMSMRHPIHMVSVKFDHRLVDLRARLEHPLWAATWCGTKGASVLLAGLLRTAAPHIADFDRTVADQLGSSLVSLVTAVCAEKLGAEGANPAAARRALLYRVKTFARARLNRSDLSPSMLARSHNISLRYLQLLFQEENTSPALWIRDQRLERCRSDLADPRTAHLTVANVAERWGLDSASHFSKLFRERYGLTPREWRRQSLPSRT